MASVYQEDNFSGRVSYAAHCFKTTMGTPQSRAFDTCFEMWDGDAVVTALVRRCETDPALKAAIARGWRTTAPELPTQWLETAARYADVPTKDLGKIAAQLRAKAKAS